MSWTRRQVLSLFRSQETTRSQGSAGKRATAKVPAAANRTSDRAWTALLESGKSHYARGKEELIIRHFFRDRRGGSFVDVGCFLPDHDNATYYLERHLGWSGLGVDAQDLSEQWRQLRPHSRFVRAVLTERPAEPVTLFLAEGASTLLPDQLDEASRSRGLDPVEMTSSTLDHILEGAGVSSIDFLSISVNGVDRRALLGLDLGRYRPDLIRIRCVPGQRLPTIETLSDSGYRLIKDYRPFDIRNRYFSRKPSGRIHP